MDDRTRKPPPEGQFQSQDADFGIFRPGPEPPTSVPNYSPWTQFSGIPPSPCDATGISWDAFVTTPPPTPSSAGDFDMKNPNFFPNYNNVMSRNSLSNYEEAVQEPDSAMLAKTPVAQSLLEALNSSNSFSPPMTEETLPVPGNMNFDSASQDGFEIYAEALKKLGSSYGSYTPFGTSDVLNASPASTSPTRELENQTSASTKPSYSEVAKTLKNSSSSGKEESDQSRKKSSSESSSAKSSFKGSKKFVTRPIRGRCNSEADDLCPTVSPDSKYGLDDFGDISTTKSDSKEEASGGLDSFMPIKRKNSTSSMSSGTSGIEEIQLPKSCNTFSNQPDTKPSNEKISNKDKEKVMDETNHKLKEEKPFFDPTRIFQSKDTNKRRSQSKLPPDEDMGPTILNNGKPSYGAWCSGTAHKKSTHYINNNLRDSQKKTNQNPGSSSKGQGQENTYPQQSSSRAEKKPRSSSTKGDGSIGSKPNMPLQTSFDQELIDEWLSFLYDKAKLCLHQLWTLVLMVLLLIFSIIVYLVSGCVHLLSWLWGNVWSLLERKLFQGRFFFGNRWRRKTVPDTPSKIGLEENIALPATGDEAMQRLLACKGKDPYSILGLKASASDDDIKKYYRRQAFLVHPDKNQQPGAEEAFKILGHAFDLIGDAAKRQAYDRQLQEATEAEAAMREFNDLLTKLQDKIQQASNMMRCDNCGGKHRRVPVERPWYSARFCDRCGIRHSAKEGDVWAETSMLGFLWHYYACMEGKVYDITEWVACKKEFFKHMQANAHHVFYRIATEGTRGHHGRSNGAGSSGAGEADLEDFISHLFHQAMSSESGGGGPGGGAGSPPSQQSWQPPTSASSQPHNTHTWNPNSGSGSSQGQTKRGRRRKKKH